LVGFALSAIAAAAVVTALDVRAIGYALTKSPYATFVRSAVSARVSAPVVSAFVCWAIREAFAVPRPLAGSASLVEGIGSEIIGPTFVHHTGVSIQSGVFAADDFLGVDFIEVRYSIAIGIQYRAQWERERKFDEQLDVYNVDGPIAIEIAKRKGLGFFRACDETHNNCEEQKC
jgi:hypothetical protein